MADRKGDWTQTYTGREFWPLDPRAEEVYIEDIAHGLSNLCRFGGQCLDFYSVAQHSLLVSNALPPELKLAGLLHDGGEAYTGDIVRPIRRSLLQLDPMIEKVQEVVYKRFGIELSEKDKEKIAWADNILLMTEMRDLMADPPMKWVEQGTIKPLERKIRAVSPQIAEQMFLSKFKSLAKR